jgi:hypothetical protein
MKSKLLSIVDNRFNLAFASLKNKEFPAAVSFQLTKISKEIQAHQELFDKTRMELINKYGEKDENGKVKENDETRMFVLADKESFNKEYKDLLELEVEHAVIPFSAIENLTLKPEILEPLVGVVISEPEL